MRYARRLTVASLACAAIGTQVQSQVPEQTLTKPDFEYSYGFTSVYSAAELSGDRVIVIARYPEGPTLVDLRAQKHTTVGTKGQGPGEWSRPISAFPLRADTTLVYDSRGAILTVAPSGTIVTGAAARVYPPGSRMDVNIDATGRLYATGYVFRSEQAADGKMAYTQGPVPVPTGVGVARLREGIRDSVAIYREGPGGRADTLGYMRLFPGAPRISIGLSNGSSSGLVPLPDPYTPTDLVAVGRDGRVAIVRSPEYRVDWVMADGRRVSGPPIATTPVRVNKADSVARRAPIGTVKPPVKSARIAPNGELWVEHERNADVLAPVFDVIGPAGTVVRRVHLPERTRLVALGQGTVYLVRIDQDDLEYIQEYRLP